jgi:hypothetical protein
MSKRAEELARLIEHNYLQAGNYNFDAKGITALTDAELAICQMVTMDTVMRDGGMDPSEAIHELGLDNPKYLALAKKENLDWIADLIRGVLAERKGI